MSTRKSGKPGCPRRPPCQKQLQRSADAEEDEAEVGGPRASTSNSEGPAPKRHRSSRAEDKIIKAECDVKKCKDTIKKCEDALQATKDQLVQAEAALADHVREKEIEDGIRKLQQDALEALCPGCNKRFLRLRVEGVGMIIVQECGHQICVLCKEELVTAGVEAVCPHDGCEAKPKTFVQISTVC